MVSHKGKRNQTRLKVGQSSDGGGVHIGFGHVQTIFKVRVYGTDTREDPKRFAASPQRKTTVHGGWFIVSESLMIGRLSSLANLPRK